MNDLSEEEQKRLNKTVNGFKDFWEGLTDVKLKGNNLLNTGEIVEGDKDWKEKGVFITLEQYKYYLDLKYKVKKYKRMVELMAEHLKTPTHSKDWVIKYFEERCK